MTAKEFLQDKTLIAIEVVDNLILNLVIEESIWGLDVDTSNIQSGTPLIRTIDFTIENDILKSNDISLDLNTTNMLGSKPPIIFE